MLDQPDDIHALIAGAPQTTEFKKLRKRIVRMTRKTIEQYGMVEKGAKWLVCLSGGKDSNTLLAVLHEWCCHINFVCKEKSWHCQVVEPYLL